MAKFLRRLKYRDNPKSFPIRDNTHFQEKNIEDALLDADLTKNIANIQNIFRQAPDLVIRRFQITVDGLEAALVYLSGLTDKELIQNHVLSPLMNSDFNTNTELPIPLGQIKIINTLSQIENAIFGGDSVLLIHSRTTAHQLDTKGWPQRSVEDAHNEIALKGAHQAFIETGSQNIAMIRRYIPHRELAIKEIVIGVRSKTQISILYLKDVASEDVLKELETRIQNITIDAVTSNGELIEFIEDHPYSPFPQFILTERPDLAVSHILQGRFVTVMDHSPNVLITPTNFISFSPVMEALLMEITLETMREGALRIPTPIGQTVGIVGGIVIGQAAVQAGIVSNIMIIVVAVTAISSFVIPNYDMGASVRLLRFPMMLAAALFGIVGLVIGWMTLIGHLSSLKSLGTSYGTPLAPFRFADMKDVFIRFPLWTIRRRPKGNGTNQTIRQGKNRNKR
ncbi:spore germination protein [Bacillus toyonensis]|uniref:spore germination protein n=1 Tax=Bacillus toyonensis TaxID=155322 RepID=UPI0001A0EB60|nr:spore germination protein [Bacillus toyonensis]EEL60133.1 Glyoxalase [Bacillus cereus Rock4-18]PEN60812.1 spore germination protein [Bacillus toyonensis]